MNLLGLLIPDPASDDHGIGTRFQGGTVLGELPVAFGQLPP
ncbi:hypothetical protein [Acrocarpospora catenulata]|nr:hypothetical protein [Acrocarpospora catenulata]